MLTWQQLRDLDRSELDHAADGWGRVSNRAHGAHRHAEQKMTGALTKTQKGESATAAVKRIKRLQDNFQYVQAECGLVRSALDGLSAELAAPQRKLKQALEDAATAKYTVEKDGSVTYPKAGQKPGGDAHGTSDPDKTKAQGIADDIAAAVRDANEIDGRYSKAIARLKAPPGLTVTPAMLVDEKGDMGAVRRADRFLKQSAIPTGESPAQIREWWNKLTPDQRADYADTYPAQIGALDGLPSDVRDEANRTVLEQTKGQLSYERDHTTSAAERTRIDNQLKGIKAIERRFARTGRNGLPPAFLLGFDTRGNGHAIIADGNPDTAKNTAVYVPGATANLANFGRYTTRADILWAAAHAQDPNGSTSTISWLGYDAPQTVPPDGVAALDPSYANQGGPRFNRFLDGLQVSQGGSQASHTTVIGHSYGSTLVGAAAKAGRLPADDVILAGSPGVLAPHAKDLDVGAQHVWTERNANDNLVPEGGRYTLGGRETWHGIPLPHSGPLGTDAPIIPGDPDFGGHNLATDPKQFDLPNDLNGKDHSSYFDPHSPVSLPNQAKVITGHGTPTEEPRRPVYVE